jgi:hypothetical protein
MGAEARTFSASTKDKHEGFVLKNIPFFKEWACESFTQNSLTISYDTCMDYICAFREGAQWMLMTGILGAGYPFSCTKECTFYRDIFL